MFGWFWNIIGRKAVEPIKKKAMLITPEQLDAVTSTIGKDRCKEMADLLNELCNSYGITEKLPFQMFLANVLQESGEFNHKEENMNYSASRLMAVWPSRFPTLASAEPFARNPVALSNKVYGGRMGNIEPNDGYKFKGAGFIGITGRELYTKYAKHIGKEVSEAAQLINKTDRYSLDSACWFFAVLKKLIPVARTGDFKAVCKGINGGYIGLDVRTKYYNKIKQVMG